MPIVIMQSEFDNPTYQHHTASSKVDHTDSRGVCLESTSKLASLKMEDDAARYRRSTLQMCEYYLNSDGQSHWFTKRKKELCTITSEPQTRLRG